MVRCDVEAAESLTGIGTSSECVEVLLKLLKTSPSNLERDLGHLKTTMSGQGGSTIVVEDAAELTRCEAVIRDLLAEIWLDFGADFFWFTTQDGAEDIDKAAMVAEQLMCGFGPARRAGVRLGALIDSRDQMIGNERARRPWAAD